MLRYENATGENYGSEDGTASFTEGRGRATFSGLSIDEAGRGFVCRFVAFNTAGVGVAWTDSDPFDVEVGDPYSIALSTSAGRMEGGRRFDISPVVAVQVRHTGTKLKTLPRFVRLLLSASMLDSQRHSRVRNSPETREVTNSRARFQGKCIHHYDHIRILSRVRTLTENGVASQAHAYAFARLSPDFLTRPVLRRPSITYRTRAETWWMPSVAVE